MDKKKYQIISGCILFLIPVLTIFGDLPFVDKSVLNLYIFQKVLFSMIGFYITTRVYFQDSNYESYNIHLFVASMAYAVINTYFLSGYIFAYLQILGGFTVFLSIPRKLYMTITGITAPLLIHAIHLKHTNPNIVINSLEKFKYDATLGALIFLFIFILGKLYLESEQKAKKEADEKVNKQNIEISKQNDLLETMMEDKTTLLHVLLHDITSPIQMIMLNDQNMVSPNENKRLKSIKNVNRYVHTIADIINNVRQIEALKSGKKTLKLDAVDINSSIDESIELLNYKLSSKNIKITKKVNLAPSTFALSEAVTLVNSVLINILSNSIKFSHNDSEIFIYAYEAKENIYIEISDQGIGIPKKILDNLFSRNVETSRKGTIGETGTGFGMPLTKTFVEKYGGSLKVHSESEEEKSGTSGTRVTIVLKKFNKSLLQKKTETQELPTQLT